MMKLALSMAVAVSIPAFPSMAIGQKTTKYTYDALGRLRTVTESGGPATGVVSTYDFDSASNRTNATVSNAPASPGSGGSSSGGSGGGAITPGVLGVQKYIIVPLNGYVIIPGR